MKLTTKLYKLSSNDSPLCSINSASLLTLQNIHDKADSKPILFSSLNPDKLDNVLYCVRVYSNKYINLIPTLGSDTSESKTVYVKDSSQSSEFEEKLRKIKFPSTELISPADRIILKALGLYHELNNVFNVSALVREILTCQIKYVDDSFELKKLFNAGSLPTRFPEWMIEIYSADLARITNGQDWFKFNISKCVR